MARPSKLNREELLDRALPVFWRHGLDGTTIDMLEDATGLGRQSIYHQYADKAALHREVQVRYRELTDGLLVALARSDADLTTVAAFFRQARQVMAQVGSRMCMAAKTVADMPTDLVVRETSCATAKAVRDAFQVICSRLAVQGRLRADLPPAEAADLLWVVGNGAAALSALEDDAAAERIIRRAISLVESSVT